MAGLVEVDLRGQCWTEIPECHYNSVGKGVGKGAVQKDPQLRRQGQGGVPATAWRSHRCEASHREGCVQRARRQNH